MNERIKELAAKAGIFYYRKGQLQSDMEKFVEVIVQECATAIINDRRLNDVRSAANGCVRTINEHFGVENERTN